MIVTRALTVVAVSLLGLGGGCSTREAPRPFGKTVESARDNTAVNERDRAGDTVTPLDQQNTQSDLDMTQELRQALVGDDSLSFDAKNIKIITSAAAITLRGPVVSEAEKVAIEARARRIGGVAAVDNQLEVAR